jgi:hypothetical protein
MDIEAIKKLIETDRNTRAEVKRQHDKRQHLKEDIEAEKKDLHDIAWKDVNARVDATKKELDEQIAGIAAKSEAYYDEASADLKSQYEAHKDAWAKELYERIVTVKPEGKNK